MLKGVYVSYYGLFSPFPLFLRVLASVNTRRGALVITFHFRGLDSPQPGQQCAYDREHLHFFFFLRAAAQLVYALKFVYELYFLRLIFFQLGLLATLCVEIELSFPPVGTRRLIHPHIRNF